MKRHTAAGFSIIELMIALTCLAILLGVGIPSFRATVENNRLVAANNDFISALNYARSEALKRSNPVSLCSSTDGTTCSGTTTWNTGYIAFGDTNANGTLDGAETVLQAWPATDPNFALTSTTRTFVRYTSTGVTTGTETFGLLKTGCTGNKARQITISVTGRIRSTVAACP
jgi:type IV fimbrial biogenesis protein FimT